MEKIQADATSIDKLIAQRLKMLRVEHGWSLEELANQSTISRATLSRMENMEVSPTASVLGKLCAIYGLTMSRLMHMVEDNFAPLIHRSNQAIWFDQTVGFQRRLVSPPAHALAAEVIECILEPGSYITYDHPPRAGLEHHLLLLEGALRVSVNGHTYELQPGDCLRYQLFGPSSFATSDQGAAKYLLFLV